MNSEVFPVYTGRDFLHQRDRECVVFFKKKTFSDSHPFVTIKHFHPAELMKFLEDGGPSFATCLQKILNENLIFFSLNGRCSCGIHRVLS